MAVSLKHTFQSAKADGADSSLVQPSNWNAEHTFTMATNRLLGRTTASTGAAEEITVGSGLSFASTTLALSLSSANSWTGTQTLAGSTSALAAILTNTAEVATVSATAATGVINYDISTQSVLYYTSNASADWTPNFRMSSSTSLNTAMTTGQAVTVAFLVTQGATAYKSTAVQIDGSAITPKWQGGTAPTAGSASSIDVYTYTIVKTGSAAFTVFASITKFA